VLLVCNVGFNEGYFGFEYIVFTDTISELHVYVAIKFDASTSSLSLILLDL